MPISGNDAEEGGREPMAALLLAYNSSDREHRSVGIVKGFASR